MSIFKTADNFQLKFKFEVILYTHIIHIIMYIRNLYILLLINHLTAVHSIIKYRLLNVLPDVL